MKERLAVYAGTFDPLTIGHIWVIEKGVELFDRLIVAIGVNPEKHCMFSIKERLEMLRKSTQLFPNIETSTYENQFLVNYAQSVGAKFILRGLRSDDDYRSENGMKNINNDLNPAITTVFLMPPRKISDISSSTVKGLIGPEGWEKIVKGYVPDPVFEKIVKEYYARKK